MNLSDPPVISFHRVPINPDHVREMVGLSRTVVRWNGNRTGATPIQLITDNMQLAKDALVPQERAIADESPHLVDNSRGLYWGHSGVMWVRPNKTTPSATVKTLAHEMAHACTAGHHHHGWRRLYAVLLPLWWRALRPNDKPIDICHELSTVVEFYAGKRMPQLRRLTEVADHVQASKRAFARWAPALEGR